MEVYNEYWCYHWNHAVHTPCVRRYRVRLCEVHGMTAEEVIDHLNRTRTEGDGPLSNDELIALDAAREFISMNRYAFDEGRRVHDETPRGTH